MTVTSNHEENKKKNAISFVVKALGKKGKKREAKRKRMDHFHAA